MLSLFKTCPLSEFAPAFTCARTHLSTPMRPKPSRRLSAVQTLATIARKRQTVLHSLLLQPWHAMLNSLPKHTFPSQCSTRQVSRPAGRGMFAFGTPSRMRVSVRGRASLGKEPPFSAPSCPQKTQASIAKRSSKKRHRTGRSISKPSMHIKMVHAS